MLHARIDYLPTSGLFTVVKHLVIDVPLDTALIDEHVFAIFSDEKKVTFRKSTPVSIVKQNDVSSNAVFEKHNMQDANTNIHVESKDDQGSAIKIQTQFESRRQRFLNHSW